MRPLTISVALTLLLALDNTGVNCVQITDLRVPTAVKNGSGTPAILDCEYSLRADEHSAQSGLVVKWFFNNGPAPVYQWIPRQKPQDLGILRGKLDLSYKVSRHHATMHRALYIVNPTTELSGDYKCFVSTFQDEDFMIKPMIVYAPGKNFDLTQTKMLDLESVNVTCKAQSVYPEPKLTIFKSPDKKSVWPIAGVKMKSVPSAVGDGFDVTGTVVVPWAPEEAQIGCQLTIPGTPHTQTKYLRYLSVSGGSSLRWLGGLCLYLICILLVSLAAPPAC